MASPAAVICRFRETYHPYGYAGEVRAVPSNIAPQLAHPRDHGEPVVDIIGAPQPRDKSRDMPMAPSPGAFSDAQVDVGAALAQMAAAIAELTKVVTAQKTTAKREG